MKKISLYISLLFLLVGCATSDYDSLIRASMSQDASAAMTALAKQKSIHYATNPEQLSRDVKSIDTNLATILSVLVKNVSATWGSNNVEVPQQKEYVKYMQNYKSRALVDFDAGLITVETLDTTNVKESLKNAIVTTLLLPEDPRSADLFGSEKIKLGGTPYLLGEVVDDQNKVIRYNWRATRYANILLKNNYKVKNITRDNKSVAVHYVTFEMLKDHGDIRAKKFKPYVQKYAKQFNVSENLIYAIIRTESNFNQFAVSGAGAFGLMQLVPTSGGKDAYKFVTKSDAKPTKDYLFNAENNIKLGAAYIHILGDRYLPGINNPISKEYCVISAYNTGSGNVLKTFNTNRTKAKEAINSKTPSAVYKKLKSDLPYEETRRYLEKVVTYKKDFVNL